MRKIVFLSAFFAVLVLSSCDKNIGRVEKATKDFFEAVSDKDKVGYCALYPALRNSKTLTVKPSLKCEDIDVDYSKEDSTYISTINDKFCSCCISCIFRQIPTSICNITSKSHVA